MTEDGAAPRRPTGGASAPVTVCVPVWNGARFIPALIDSVLAQQASDWLLVIGDNASTDDLGAVVARYADPRITYHRWDSHVGPNENFNRTMDLARSPWLLPIGADDRLDPDALERFGRAAGDGLAMVVAPCRRVGVDGRSAEATYYGATQPIRVPPGRYDASSWLRFAKSGGPYSWTIGSIIFSRTALDASGGFRPDVGLAADMELIFRLAAHGDVLTLDAPVMDYLVHTDSDGNTQWDRNLRDRDAEVPLARALLSALAAHSTTRTVSTAERRAVIRGAAMTYLNRAVQHRLHPGAGGRRAALVDVARAWRMSPEIVLTARADALAVAAIAAPTRVLRWVGAALRQRRR